MVEQAEPLDRSFAERRLALLRGLVEREAERA